MPYALRPVDDRYFDAAPNVIPATVELDAAPEQVWDALGSDRMWSWVPAIDQLRWTTPRGEGGIRVLRLGRLLTIEEEFYRWEPPYRATFRVTQQSRRVFDGLAEDFRLEPTAAGGTRLTWTMAQGLRGVPGGGALGPLKGLVAKGNAAGIAGIKTIL